MNVSAGRLARAAVPSAATLALAVSLTACRGSVDAAAQAPASTPAAATAADPPAAAAASATSPAAAAASTTPPATAATSPQAQGALSVSVTSPIAVHGSVAAPVSCVTGRVYRATVSGATVSGSQFSFTVAIADYRGPGSYPSVVAVTLRQASGVVTAIAGTARTPAVITASGGSFTVSATGTEGRTISGSLAWTCGS
jgi:hypothetical protein